MACAEPQQAQVNTDISSVHFAAPKNTMILKRVVRRTLSDGKEIIVTRSYDLHFTAINGGYRIDGQLHDVNIEAPPLLAALASLERNRRDDAIFPIFINTSGEITSSLNTPIARNAQAASGIVKALFESSALPAPDKQFAQKFYGPHRRWYSQ